MMDAMRHCSRIVGQVHMQIVLRDNNARNQANMIWVHGNFAYVNLCFGPF